MNPRTAHPDADRSGISYFPLHVAATGCIAIIAYTALSLGLYEPRASHDPIAVGCGLALIGLIVYARYALRLPWMSPSVAYLAIFWLSYFGLAFTAVVVPDVLKSFDARPSEIRWMYWPNVRLTMILSLLGAAGFMFGVGMTAGRPAERQGADVGEREHDSAMFGIGWLLMLVGIAASLYALLSNGGLGVFALSYREVRAYVLSATFQTSTDLSQFGCMLAICAAGGRRWVWPLAVWTSFGCVLLLLGLRNEAMIPWASYLIVLTYRGIRFKRGLILAAVVAAFVLFPAIKMIRAVGLRNSSEITWTELSPLATLTEFGITLRSATVYVDLIEEGSQYLLGASYWAPFDRQVLTRLVPGRKRIPYAEDRRIPGAQISLREGGLGEASMGEAYYNFGPVGPFIYLGCVGALFGWFERRRIMTPYRFALLGAVMLLFYWDIRGGWIQLPARMAFAVVVLAVCHELRRLARRPTPVQMIASQIPSRRVLHER